MGKTQKTALILGASGHTGRFCLQNLLESECYGKVIALVRSEITIEHPKLKQYVIDFDYTKPMEPLYVGVDDVFCCLGTTLKEAGSQGAFRRVDFHIPTEAANLASSAGVNQFIAISTLGANNRASNLNLRFKGEMEKGITQFQFKGTHIFRPASLIVDHKESRQNDGVNRFFSKLFAPLMGGDNTKYKAVEAKDLAKAMLNAALLAKEGECYYSSSQIFKLAVRKVPCEPTGGN